MATILPHVFCLVGLALSGVSASLISVPAGCEMTIHNDGPVGGPDAFKATCAGSCNAPFANPCDVYTTTFLSWEDERFVTRIISTCTCNGIEVWPATSQACVANFNNSGGAWHVICTRDACPNACVPLAPLPSPQSDGLACKC
jgi:hypothetical protein